MEQLDFTTVAANLKETSETKLKLLQDVKEQFKTYIDSVETKEQQAVNELAEIVKTTNVGNLSTETLQALERDLSLRANQALSNVDNIQGVTAQIKTNREILPWMFGVLFVILLSVPQFFKVLEHLNQHYQQSRCSQDLNSVICQQNLNRTNKP